MPEEPVTPESESQEEEAPEGGEEPQAQVATATAQGGGSEVPSDDEIAKLRSEAASWRKKLRDAEAELKKHRDANKSDLERTQSEVDDLKTQLEAAEKRARKGTVLAVAGDVGIVREARSDAADLLDWSEIEDPTDEKAVEKALRNLIKEKPYLTGGVAGGADGGAGGRGGTRATSMNDVIRQAAGRR